MTSAGPPTRYEQITRAHSQERGDLAAALAEASRRTRATVAASGACEAAIRYVAAGVRGPALVGYGLWLRERVAERGWSGCGSCPGTRR